MNPDMSLTVVVLFVLLPLWVLAGLADWMCHRRSDLAETTGIKESLFHLLMLLEMGVLLMAVLLFEFTAIVLAIMIAAFVVHQITAYLDVRYADSRRTVTPLEQQIHSVLEMLPLMVILIGAALFPEAVMALVGWTEQPGQFDLVWKEQPLPVNYLITILLLTGALEFLPYGEELWRAYRHHLARRREEQAKQAFLLHRGPDGLAN